MTHPIIPSTTRSHAIGIRQGCPSAFVIVLLLYILPSVCMGENAASQLDSTNSCSFRSRNGTSNQPKTMHVPTTTSRSDYLAVRHTEASTTAGWKTVRGGASPDIDSTSKQTLTLPTAISHVCKFLVPPIPMKSLEEIGMDKGNSSVDAYSAGENAAAFAAARAAGKAAADIVNGAVYMYRLYPVLILSRIAFAAIFNVPASYRSAVLAFSSSGVVEKLAFLVGLMFRQWIFYRITYRLGVRLGSFQLRAALRSKSMAAKTLNDFVSSSSWCYAQLLVFLLASCDLSLKVLGQSLGFWACTVSGFWIIPYVLRHCEGGVDHLVEARRDCDWNDVTGSGFVKSLVFFLKTKLFLMQSGRYYGCFFLGIITCACQKTLLGDRLVISDILFQTFEFLLVQSRLITLQETMWSGWGASVAKGLIPLVPFEASTFVVCFVSVACWY